MKITLLIILLITALTINCNSTKDKVNKTASQIPSNDTTQVVFHDTTIRTAHIFVALCDNKYQGIIPVPKAIGNGEDYNNNLYWGCSYGIKSYFKQSKNWLLLKQFSKDSLVLERLVFKHKFKEFYLIADAYKGKNIKECTIDFLNSSCGKLKDSISVNGKILGIQGNSKLVTYIGHNGLMDFRLTSTFSNADNKNRDAIVLACKSKKYFLPFMQQAKANLKLSTTDLMCPEAYTIHDVLEGYIKDNNNKKHMQNLAAKAYAKHQKCSQNSASKLLVSE